MGIRLVEKSSWKEREVGKSEVGKNRLKLAKNRAKLERTERSWKASFEVGKYR